MNYWLIWLSWFEYELSYIFSGLPKNYFMVIDYQILHSGIKLNENIWSKKEKKNSKFKINKVSLL